jgi:ubiquinone/menaquinone biosynthesis C-methylase UbiE
MPALQASIQVLIDELEPQLGDRILDLGTGTGRLGIVLSQIVPEGFVVGVDSNSAMLKVAQQELLAFPINNLFLTQGRAEDLPFLSQTFDSACMVLSFHHFSDPVRALGEIHRVLRDEGHLNSVAPVLKEAMEEDEETLNKLIGKAFQLAHGAEFRFFTAQELRRLYEENSFSIESYQTYTYPFQQIGIEGIPMGPHWLQAYELLQARENKSSLEKFEQNYFSFQGKEDKLLVRGKMSWATIKAAKR